MDAYEKIKGKELSVASCWMHCRKYFAIAVMAGCNVLKLWDGKTEEEIRKCKMTGSQAFVPPHQFQHSFL